MPVNDATIQVGLSINEAQAFRDMERVFSRMERRFGNKQLPLGTISSDFRQFEKSLAAAENRVLAFGATVGVLYGFIRGTKALVQSTIEVEKSLKDVNVILQTTDKGLKQFGDNLF